MSKNQFTTKQLEVISKLVSEKIMHPVLLDSVDEKHGVSPTLAWTPPYSTRLDWAWGVAEKFKSCQVAHEDGYIVVTLTTDEKQVTGMFDGHGVPAAICVTALQAMGVDYQKDLDYV